MLHVIANNLLCYLFNILHCWQNPFWCGNNMKGLHWEINWGIYSLPALLRLLLCLRLMHGDQWQLLTIGDHGDDYTDLNPVATVQLFSCLVRMIMGLRMTLTMSMTMRMMMMAMMIMGTITPMWIQLSRSVCSAALPLCGFASSSCLAIACNLYQAPKVPKVPKVAAEQLIYRAK